MKLGFIGKFWFETHLKYLVTLMLSNLTLKKSKQTEKLKVITFFSVAHFGLLLPKTRLILAPIWPFLKNFWFRFRFLKDNSMMMINSTDFASNLQKNRKMWTISYLLRWRNNCRVLLLVYLGGNCLREESIQGRKLFAEIRYLLLISMQNKIGVLIRSFELNLHY